MQASTAVVGAGVVTVVALALLTFDRTGSELQDPASPRDRAAPAASVALPAAAIEARPTAATTPRDLALPHRFELLGVMVQTATSGAQAGGRAWIAVDGEPARLVALDEELRPGIRLRQIAADRVRIANDDSTMVWSVSVTYPTAPAAVPESAGRGLLSSAVAQLNMQAGSAGQSVGTPAMELPAAPAAAEASAGASDTMLRLQSGQGQP